ncbi:MAG: hypothetical protein M0Z48_09470 [Nitrospiraceae bacterium]|nr:hypothetical protein [Nitrospiraceae bacterium]
MREAHLGNESGMTLVIVIVLAAAALIIMSGLIYMVTSGAELSGMAQRYTTAVQAAVGAVDLNRQFIEQQGAVNFTNNTINFATNPNLAANCLTAKLTQLTAAWPAGNCSKASTIDPTVNTSWDMTATLGQFQVYAKIVDTDPGNTAQASGLVKTGVVQANGQGTVRAIPYIYTIEALSVSPTGERSKLSGVYEY